MVPEQGPAAKPRTAATLHPQWRNTVMRYRTLGRTGVQVSSLALGAMNFGKIGRTTQDEVTAIVDAALEGGINLIDTADMYSSGESEEMVGKAIAGRRDDIVLATKASMPMGDERKPPGQFAPLAGHRTRRQPAPPRRGPRRPLPDPPVGPEDQ
jgi:aryl-alcohol dehydrogenase-like predicted oxidoreductase